MTAYPLSEARFRSIVREVADGGVEGRHFGEIAAALRPRRRGR